MQHWIKTIYNDSGRRVATDWQSFPWVSDGPQGRRPHYEIGDDLLLYDASNKVFPARVRVLEEPADLPRLVDSEGGPGEGRRWPYVTYVKVLGAVDHSVAPTPRMLKIAMSQGGHRRLDEATYNLAASHIPDGFAGPRLSESLCRPIPIEQATDEPFEQRYEQRTNAVYRREQLLVERPERHLRKRATT